MNKREIQLREKIRNYLQVNAKSYAGTDGVLDYDKLEMVAHGDLGISKHDLWILTWEINCWEN